MATANTLRSSRDSTRDDEASLENSVPFDTEAFCAELRRLADTNEELVGKPQLNDPRIAQLEEELELFRMENTELHARVAELEQALQHAGGGEESWLERQQEYEKLLEEKSEVIRSLHMRLQQQPAQAATAPSGPGNTVVHGGQAEEILRLKRELEESRRQLQEDEEAMMLQMKQMEMAMARDRAEMARQRSEIQRMQAEHDRGLEQANRDPQLQERLHNLRRPESMARLSKPSVLGGNPQTPPKEPPGGAPNGQASSGLLRRIFG